MNQGLICMSTERIIVVETVADEFAARFKETAGGMAVGDPRDGNTPIGAVVDKRTVDCVSVLIRDALDKRAEDLVGGNADGVLMPAHVIDKVTPEMRLFRDESFGPIVAITRA